MRIALDAVVRRWPLSRWSVAVGAVSLAGAGCALTAPAPGGALHEGGFLQVQPTWAVSYAPGDATVHAATPGVLGNGGALRGNTQSFGGDQGLALIGAVVPISVAVRQSIGRRVDVAADGGWFDSGVELRVGVPDRTARSPFVVSAGARTGRIGALPVDQAYQLRLRVEAYRRSNPEDEASGRAVLALGAAFGSFIHDMAIPAPPDPNPPEIGSGPPHVMFFRDELRLEGVVGYQTRGRHVSWLFGVAPWIVVAHGAPRSKSSDWIVDAFSQSVGVSFIASVGLGSDPWTASTEPPAFSR